MDESEDSLHKLVHIKGTVLAHRISLQLSYALASSAISPDIQISQASQCTCGAIAQSCTELVLCPHLIAVLVTIYRTGLTRIEKFQSISELIDSTSREVGFFFTTYLFRFFS
jgi:hypothetical protein